MDPVPTDMCERCSTIPWDQLANGYPDQELFVLSETAEELQTSSCRICRLLGAALVTNNFRSVSTRLEWRADQFRCGNRVGNILFCYKLPLDDELKSPTLTVTVEKPAEIQKILLGMNASERVDMDKVRNWVGKCQNAHKRCSAGVQLPLNNLRVIDCLKKRVVPAPVDCAFVALSYVWGSPHNTGEHKAYNLLSNVPSTVEDSIKITQSLGYRYLWIDKYVCP